MGRDIIMGWYTVKVNCEYYVEVDAESEDEALDLAVEADYSISDLQNFYYEIDEYPKDEEDEDDG